MSIIYLLSAHSVIAVPLFNSSSPKKLFSEGGKLSQENLPPLDMIMYCFD